MNHVDLTHAHTHTRLHFQEGLPSSSTAPVKVTADASGCGTAQRGVNTSDGERDALVAVVRRGGREWEWEWEEENGRGWCEEEKGVAGGRDAEATAAVSSGLWNQELCALRRPCTTTPTPPPGGPLLRSHPPTSLLL